MKSRLLLLFLSVFAIHAQAQYGPALNKDGSVVTGVLTAAFDPTAGGPFPNNLFFTAGGSLPDGTIDLPVEDPNDVTDPFVVLSALDGFSTTERWITTFVDDDGNPGSIGPSSVVPGQSVRVFKVTTVPGNPLAVTGVDRELVPGLDYWATVANGNTLVILPLKPLPQYSSFMAVLTNDIKDADGNDATAERTYFLAKRRTPWIDANGNSTYPLLPDSSARGLEPLRQLVNLMEAAAASQGIDPNDIILSWTVQTQSITPTLQILRSLAQPAPTTVGPVPGATTALLGGLGLADLYAGIITVPYYGGVPSEANPTAPLNQVWKAAPGGYIPPYDQLGLDPNSTNLTLFNPIPVKTSDQTVPLFITVPNANSGQSKPEAGWPVVIYGHGVGSNRVEAATVADSLAAAGYVVVAMDFPIHGISPDFTPQLAPLYIENTPFAPIANERTFDLDIWNNETGAPGPDGLIDPPIFNALFGGMINTLGGRDAVRQGIADLSVLTLSLPGIDLDGDSMPDLNGSDVAFVGHSWGAIHGGPFSALEPLVTRSFLSSTGGGLARFIEASEWLRPIVRAFLSGLAGLEPGTADYELFFTVWQTAVDSADPINWADLACNLSPIMVHEVLENDVIPNSVPTAPLSGSGPLIAAMGLTAYDNTVTSPDGLCAVGRFVPPAAHSSLNRPTAGTPREFFEMQRQMVSFIASGGGTIVVNDPGTMLPLVAPTDTAVDTFDFGAFGKKGRSTTGPVGGQLQTDPGSVTGLNIEVGDWAPLLRLPQIRPLAPAEASN